MELGTWNLELEGERVPQSTSKSLIFVKIWLTARLGRMRDSDDTQTNPRKLKIPTIPSVLLSMQHCTNASNAFPLQSSLIIHHVLNHAGLLFTNSSRSLSVATPNTNLLVSSVTTAKSCFVPLPSPLKKASSSSNGVFIVMTL